MCYLYSITTNQEAIRRLFRKVNRYVGNLAPMPDVFHPAPVIRNAGDGAELVVMRWGIPHRTNSRSLGKQARRPIGIAPLALGCAMRLRFHAEAFLQEQPTHSLRNDNSRPGFTRHGGRTQPNADMSFRAAAEECRRLAARATDPVKRRRLNHTADQWLKLAQFAGGRVEGKYC
jgi:hypothetical protein